MKKLLVVILTLSLVIGMFSFAAFADQGNSSGQSNEKSSANRKTNSDKDKNNEDNQGDGSTVHAAADMDVNATALNALLNKDAALDRSVGNTEDNSDKVWGSYLKVFKPSSDNKKNPKISSKLNFTNLIAVRKTANDNWDTINRLNKEIKKAFDKYRASLKGLTSKEEAIASMEIMKRELNEERAKIAEAHGFIKALRLQKDAQWKSFRADVKAGAFDKAQITLDSDLNTVDIVDLKRLITQEQENIISAKHSIRDALVFVPGKVPAVPTFSPNAGPVLTGTSITIKSPGAKVFYTTTPPGFELTTKSGIEFTKKLVLVSPTTIVRAFAFKNGVKSAEVSAVYFAQDYATAPFSYTITVGAITKTMVGPAAGSTTKGSITGIGENKNFRFTVVDAPTPAKALSSITINGIFYTNGSSIDLGYIDSDHGGFHDLKIVVTTKESDRITAVRTFIIEFRN